MSDNPEIAVRSALEAALIEIDPSTPLARVNVDFDMPAANVLFYIVEFDIEADNPTMGDDFYRLDGMMTVTIAAPENEGDGPALERAELIRRKFKRGLPFTADSVTTQSQRTPSFGRGWRREGRYMLPVEIRFFANIGG